MPALACTTGCGPGAPPLPSPPAPAPAAVSGAADAQRPLPAGRAGVPEAGLPTVADPRDATAVAAAAATADWTVDAALDTSFDDAQRRSLPWLTPGYAARVAAARPVAAPGVDWVRLAAHHGFTTVRATRAFDDPPPDTPRSVWRQFRLAVTAHGRDGWRGPTTVHVQYVRLTRPRAGAPWRVAEMRVAQ